MRTSLLVAAIVSLHIVLMGCSREKTLPKVAAKDVRQAINFRDVTKQSGVDFVYDNGESAGECTIVESLGGGVGLFDYDRDSYPDLVFPGGGKIQNGQPLSGLPTRMWRNTGKATFAEVSANVRFDLPSTLTHGCSAADWDNDGFMDFIVTGYKAIQLFRNQGDGTFVDFTIESGITDDEWSSSAAWGDFNQDGNVDLYIAHYVDWSWSNNPKCPSPIAGVNDVCSPNEFGPRPHAVFFSNGDGTFQNMSNEVGLDAGGKGLGVVLSDFNGDHHLDVYVANDTTNNFLYLNDGKGRFRDVGLVSGTAVDGNGTPNGSMGLAVLDFNSDLKPDLWVTNYENETYALYLNSGPESFSWATDRVGLTALGKLFVGFGTVGGDFDKDGDEDLVVANGHVILHPAQSQLKQHPVYLENTMSGSVRKLRRVEFTEEYFAFQHRGRGLVSGDIDLDGDMDLVFSNVQEPAAILCNDTPSDGQQLQVELIGVESDRNAIGATCVLQTNKGKYLRSVVGGGSYLSQNPYKLTWGIPVAEVIESLEITWPNGQRQTRGQLTCERVNVVTQRAGGELTD